MRSRRRPASTRRNPTEFLSSQNMKDFLQNGPVRRQEEQYAAIIGAMSNVYFGLYFIDLKNNTFQELISIDMIHHALGEKGEAREALRHMTRELVGDSYLPTMLKFTDYDTIDERLGTKPILVQDYATRSGGWTQCTFIPVERVAPCAHRVTTPSSGFSAII